MKEFRAEIGGKERVLRYTFADARALKRRFGPLPKALAEDGLGMFSITNVDPDFQVAFVSAGLRHERDLKDLPVEEVEETVARWFGDLCGPEGGGVGPVILAAFKAALYAGIVHGKSIDYDGEITKQVELRRVLYPESAAGKGAPAAEEPPPAA